jgi:hypothetical protein
MGIFQYFLLYACPKPGKTAENVAANLGECFVFKLSCCRCEKD